MHTIRLRPGRFDDEVSEGLRIYRQVDEILNTFEGGTLGPVKVEESACKDPLRPTAFTMVAKHAKIYLDGGAETGIHQFTYFDAEGEPVVPSPEAIGPSRWFRSTSEESDVTFMGDILEFDAVYVTLTIRVPYDTTFGMAEKDAQAAVAKDEMVAAVEQTNAVVRSSYARASLENRVHILASDGEVKATNIPNSEAMLFGGNSYHVVPASTPIHKAIHAIVTR